MHKGGCKCLHQTSRTGKLQARNLNIKGDHTSQKRCEKFQNNPASLLSVDMMPIVTKNGSVFLRHVEGKEWVGFVVNHTEGEHLRIKSKRIKVERYRTSHIL